jgi:hypothetical protein
VPSPTRKTYSTDEYEPEEITAFANISSISDTWFDEEIYSLAIQRLEEVRKQKPQQQIENIRFVINDDITYTQLSDFKLPENVLRYQQLTTLRKRQVTINESLNKNREAYAIASKAARKELTNEILAYEQEILMLHQETHNLEKAIRNAENTFLTKNK